MKYDLIIAQAQIAIRKKQRTKISDQGPEFELQIIKSSIGILNKRIHKIENDLEKHAEAKQVIKAQNLLCIPGIIDSQVHFREPGVTHKEDLQSGTRAAIAGGVTSVLEMPNTKPSTTSLELFEQKCQLSQNRIHANIGFFIGANATNFAEIEKTEKTKGCCGTKIFMGSSTGELLLEDDDKILKHLQTGFRRTAFHAEDEALLQLNKEQFKDQHEVRMHPEIRNSEVALRATKRVLSFFTKTKKPLHLLHISSKEEIQCIADFKSQIAFDRKDFLSVETTPQFLLLSAPECYERLGALAQMNPPIRYKEDQASLWWALKKGIIDVLATDHAPHLLEEKRLSYPQSPSGMPGVQTFLPLMLQMIADNKMNLDQMIQLACENPSMLYHIKDRGFIQEGAFADLCLIDLGKNQKIENSWIESKCKWTPFDGLNIQGWPIYTIVNGNIAMQEGEILKPQGELLEFEAK